MNIDELKKEIEAKRFTKDQGMDMEMYSYNDGINDAVRILEAHRPDLGGTQAVIEGAPPGKHIISVDYGDEITVALISEILSDGTIKVIKQLDDRRGGTLRFRKTEHGFYREIDLEGNWLHEDGINEREVQYYNKETAIKDCERRGLTATFKDGGYTNAK